MQSGSKAKAEEPSLCCRDDEKKDQRKSPGKEKKVVKMSLGFKSLSTWPPLEEIFN